MIRVFIKFPVGNTGPETLNFMLFERQIGLNQFGSKGITQNFVRLKIFKGILEPECNGLKRSGFGTIDIIRGWFTRVNFIYDEAELTEISKSKVNLIIERIKLAENLTIEIYTYTDNIGSNGFNLKLLASWISIMQPKTYGLS